MTKLATLIALGAFSLAAATSPATPMEEGHLRKLAVDAKTSAQHLDVANHYEARARHFEAKAVKHEQTADELANRSGYNPMKHKWPAMAQGPIDRARGQAMHARRAAKESFTLAAKHKDLAAEVSSAAAAE